MRLTLWASSLLMCSWAPLISAEQLVPFWEATTFIPLMPTITSIEKTNGERMKRAGHPLVRDEAAEYIASRGERLGPHLNSALAQFRTENPQFAKSSDLEVAQWIINSNW